MDVTRSAQGTAAKPAQSVPQAEAEMRTDLRPDRLGAAAPGEGVHKFSGYGLPCAKCRLYYPANLDVCPTCKGKERVSPNVMPVKQNAKAVAEAAPEASAVE